MPKKSPSNQSIARRTPTQERSRQKTELILEAAIRIIDQDGLAGLTTNRVAELAGVSIGTLYQYFPNKQAIVAALGRRELRSITATMIGLLEAPPGGAPADPARALIRAVFGAFGGRSAVHRVLLENELALRGFSQLDESPSVFAGLLADSGLPGPDGRRHRLSPVDAFVLTHAFTGVIRASVGERARHLSRASIEESLLRLVRGFVVQAVAPGSRR